MSVRTAVAVAVAVAGTLAAAAPSASEAAAASYREIGPGVFVSPGSPAGKEYTAPLTALRGAASGHAAGRDQTEPLFGIGITPSAPSRSAGTEGSAPGRIGVSRNAGATRARGARPSGARAGGASRASSAALESLTHHGSPTPTMMLLAAVVVLGGLALGALLVAAWRRLE